MWTKWRGGVAKKLMAAANEEAIFQTLSEVGKAATKLVPLDEAALQNSQYVEVEGGKGIISYGGGQGTEHPEIPYAVKHHEVPANFQGTGRGNNYLRDPFNKLARKTYKKTMQKEGRKRL